MIQHAKHQATVLFVSLDPWIKPARISNQRRAYTWSGTRSNFSSRRRFVEELLVKENRAQYWWHNICRTSQNLSAEQICNAGASFLYYPSCSNRICTPLPHRRRNEGINTVSAFITYSRPKVHTKSLFSMSFLLTMLLSV